MVTAMSVAIWLNYRSECAASTLKGLGFVHGSGARFGCELSSCTVSKSGRQIDKVHFEKMAGPTGGPPGLGWFGDAGEVRLNFNRMAKGMMRLKEVCQGADERGLGDVHVDWVNV